MSPEGGEGGGVGVVTSRTLPAVNTRALSWLQVKLRHTHTHTHTHTHYINILHKHLFF